jgi:F1F0 ATPase subunit 2
VTEVAILILALFMGIVLGTIFYGGLWWTVRRIVSSKSPGVWLIGSFLLRAMIAAGGFLFVARGDWRSILACFIGFLAARIGVTRLTRAPLDTKTRVIEETSP